MNTSRTGLNAIAVCLLALPMHAQLSAPQAQETPAPDGATLRVNVNAVLVPVVVRDAQGRAVGNLTQNDFKVFDQGKQRPITGFTVQQAAISENAQNAAAANGAAAPVPQPDIAPKRFIVFLFDDRHMSIADLEQAKKAGIRMLDEPLADGDRAVVLSFMGINSGMTHARASLQAAILKLKPQQVYQHDASQCPDIDYYTADQILNKHSKTEWDIAYERAADCAHQSSKSGITPNGTGFVEQLVRAAANQALMAGDQDVRATLDYLKEVVHTMSSLPGQRTLIFVSPGFLSDTDEAVSLESQLLDVAAAANVTISALDARGLSAGNIDASQGTAGSVFSNITGQPVQDHLESMREDEDVMADLADGTGGMFFHNSNDLAGGLKTLTAGPEYLYLLQLSLQNVKENGAFHSLKVEVDRSGLKLQARRGYAAPLPPKKK
jgi:VWFA-related protein